MMTERIYLDGQMSSKLDWNTAIKHAEKAKAEGRMILWQIDLGLFSELQFPLSDQTQFLSLCLALEHFRDQIWPHFQDHTEGLCLYKGSPDFTHLIPWEKVLENNLISWIKEIYQTEESFNADTGYQIKSFQSLNKEVLLSQDKGRDLLALFARDTAAEYIGLLTTRVPDGLQAILEFETKQIENPVLGLQLMAQDRYPRIAIRDLDGSFLQTAKEDVKLGVCWPQMEKKRFSHYQGFHQALLKLKEKQVSYRLIPEVYLTSEWDGLDELIVCPEGLSPQGIRKLQGFCAAGGTILSLGVKLGLASETQLF
jgi:hypothetical protein